MFHLSGRVFIRILCAVYPDLTSVIGCLPRSRLLVLSGYGMDPGVAVCWFPGVSNVCPVPDRMAMLHRISVLSRVCKLLVSPGYVEGAGVAVENPARLC